MGHREEVDAHNELERADDLLRAVRGVLLNRIAAAKKAGDSAATQRHEETLGEVVADERRLIADEAYRKAILSKYPGLLESLR